MNKWDNGIFKMIYLCVLYLIVTWFSSLPTMWARLSLKIVLPRFPLVLTFFLFFPYCQISHYKITIHRIANWGLLLIICVIAGINNILGHKLTKLLPKYSTKHGFSILGGTKTSKFHIFALFKNHLNWLEIYEISIYASI